MLISIRMIFIILNTEHGLKTSQKMGVEVLENEIIFKGGLRKDPVISKIRLNNPRDKSGSNFGFSNKSANEGLKLNMQSRYKNPRPNLTINKNMLKEFIVNYYHPTILIT